MKRQLYRLVLLLTLLPVVAVGQNRWDTTRIAVYNVMNFDGGDSDRLSAFRVVLADLKPDLLAVIDIGDKEGYRLLLDSVMVSLNGAYRGVPYVDGPDTDQLLIYNARKFELTEASFIATGFRNAGRYTLRFVNSDHMVNVYVPHLKTGNSRTDSLQRLAEAEVIADSMVARSDRTGNRSMIVLGGMNVYGLEAAFLRIETYAADVNFSGIFGSAYPEVWSGNPEMARFHTQSTRVRQFGGGASGGLDDRFDMAFMTLDFIAGLPEGRILKGTGGVFGNDGMLFNDSVNSPDNGSVSAETARALHDASDHLPVYVDIRYRKLTSGIKESDSDELIERLLDLW